MDNSTCPQRNATKVDPTRQAHYAMQDQKQLADSTQNVHCEGWSSSKFGPNP